MYEFLVCTISKALIDNDKKKSSTALKIVKRHFKPGTELYKEYRLINSLVRTTVSSETVAASIIQEAKSAARSYDVKALDKEKSLLISVVNRTINADDSFYDHQVNEYKICATIQTLLNDWRSSDCDLGRMAQYEDQLTKHLITPKSAAPDAVITEDSSGTSRLLMKVMMKKLNEKYAGVLSDDQRQLIRAYAFSTVNDDPGTMKKKLSEVKERLLFGIASYEQVNSDNEYVNKKLSETRERIEDERLDVIDDDTVTRFMLYAKLGSELVSDAERCDDNE